MNSDFREHSRKSRPFPDRRETGEVTPQEKISHRRFRSQHANQENILKIRGGRVPKKG